MHPRPHGSPFSHFQAASCILMPAWTRAHTHTCSAGHESTAHCDSCRCRNGNFNEVGTAVVVSSPFLVRENDTLSTLPKNGPVISLEIEATTPVSLSPNNPSPLCVYTCHVEGEVNKELIDLVHSCSAFSHLSFTAFLFLTACLLSRHVTAQKGTSAFSPLIKELSHSLRGPIQTCKYLDSDLIWLETSNFDLKGLVKIESQ